MVENIKYYFRCNFCQKLFMTMANVIYHKHKYHPKRIAILTREKLSKVYIPKCALHQRHCPYCQYKTSFKSIMNRHILKHNLASHTCDICHMPFINKVNVFIHMDLEHPHEMQLRSESVKEKVFQCLPSSFPIANLYKVRCRPVIQHCQEKYKYKVGKMFLPSKMALKEEQKRQNHLHADTFNRNKHFQSSLKSCLSTEQFMDLCFYCPYCLNRLDAKSLLTQTSNYVCPTCDMPSSVDLLIEKNLVPYEYKQSNSMAAEESFSNFPTSTISCHISDIQHTKKIDRESEVFQNNNNDDDDFDNHLRHVIQTDQKSNIDFIKTSDDDDDNDDVTRTDVNEHLQYHLHCTSTDKDIHCNICLEKTRFSDREILFDPLLIASPNKTFSKSEPTSSHDHLNFIPKRNSCVKLVSDFDDFAERPFACALCYERYSQFEQLAIHVQNHLTGAGG